MEGSPSRLTAAVARSTKQDVARFNDNVEMSFPATVARAPHWSMCPHLGGAARLRLASSPMTQGDAGACRLTPGQISFGSTAPRSSACIDARRTPIFYQSLAFTLGGLFRPASISRRIAPDLVTPIDAACGALLSHVPDTASCGAGGCHRFPVPLAVRRWQAPIVAHPRTRQPPIEGTSPE
jgi:hypothetical protein